MSIKQDKSSFPTSILFLEFPKTSLASRMTRMGTVKGLFATKIRYFTNSYLVEFIWIFVYSD